MGKRLENLETDYYKMMLGPRNVVNIRIGTSLTHFDVTRLGDKAEVEIWEFETLFVC